MVIMNMKKVNIWSKVAIIGGITGVGREVNLIIGLRKYPVFNIRS